MVCSLLVGEQYWGLAPLHAPHIYYGLLPIYCSQCIFDHVPAANDEWSLLMQPLWLNVQYSLCARRGGASGLLSDVGERVRLVHQPQLAVNVRGVARI